MSRIPESIDWQLIAAIQDGLPLVPHPYAAIAGGLGMTESEVLEQIKHLIAVRVIKRVGIVVRHRQLGYDANAMVVWNIPDRHVETAGRWLAGQTGINLCYQRQRHPPAWPYNLFCMIHGHSRTEVASTVARLAAQPVLAGCAHEILFTQRCFKQCGARYAPPVQENTAWMP